MTTQPRLAATMATRARTITTGLPARPTDSRPPTSPTYPAATHPLVRPDRATPALAAATHRPAGHSSNITDLPHRISRYRTAKYRGSIISSHETAEVDTSRRLPLCRFSSTGWYRPRGQRSESDFTRQGTSFGEIIVQTTFARSRFCATRARETSRATPIDRARFPVASFKSHPRIPFPRRHGE